MNEEQSKRMFLQFVLAVVTSFVCIASTANESVATLSPRDSWSSDFVRNSPPTTECPGGALAHLQTQMVVSDPLPPDVLRTQVPAELHQYLKEDDSIHQFWYTTDPESDDYWGFSGHLVARAGCVIFVSDLSYDN